MKKVVNLVCSNCGGSNVRIKAWFNPNTRTFTVPDFHFDGENLGDNWCEDCEQNIYLESEDEFIKESLRRDAENGDAIYINWF